MGRRVFSSIRLIHSSINKRQGLHHIVCHVWMAPTTCNLTTMTDIQALANFKICYFILIWLFMVIYQVILQDVLFSPQHLYPQTIKEPVVCFNNSSIKSIRLFLFIDHVITINKRWWTAGEDRASFWQFGSFKVGVIHGLSTKFGGWFRALLNITPPSCKRPFLVCVMVCCFPVKLSTEFSDIGRRVTTSGINGRWCAFRHWLRTKVGMMSCLPIERSTGGGVNGSMRWHYASGQLLGFVPESAVVSRSAV